MRFISIKYFFLFFIYIAFSTGNAAGAEQELEFKWAFMIRDKLGNIASIEEKWEMQLDAGTGFKFLLAYPENVYFYIYHFSAEKELALLYPENFADFNSAQRDEELLFVPPETEQWYFTGGSRGSEDLYLLVSQKRLVKLEELTGTFLRAGREKPVLKNVQQEAKQKVLNEILNLIKDNAKPALLYEKPLPIAGALRSGDRVLTVIMKEVKCVAFYYKKIRLYH